jgi:hypothetical protein
MDKCNYLSIGGAGTRGIVYVGALHAIEDQFERTYNMSYEAWRDKLKGVVGTSAGAIIALFVLLGTDRSIRKKYVEILTNMQHLIPCPDLGLLVSYYGVENGNTFKELIQELLKESGLSPDSTLGDLKRLLRKQYICIATNLHTSTRVLLSSDTDPHLRVCDAVYMSCCVPFVFQPFAYNGDLIVDGCLTCNEPDVFPPEETTSWSVTTNDPHKDIHNLPAFVQSIVYCSIFAQTRKGRGKDLVEFALDTSLSSCPAFDFHMNTGLATSFYNFGYAYMLDIMLSEKITKTIQLILLKVIQTLMGVLQEGEMF